MKSTSYISRRAKYQRTTIAFDSEERCLQKQIELDLHKEVTNSFSPSVTHNNNPTDNSQIPIFSVDDCNAESSFEKIPSGSRRKPQTECFAPMNFSSDFSIEFWLLMYRIYRKFDFVCENSVSCAK